MELLKEIADVQISKDMLMILLPCDAGLEVALFQGLDVVNLPACYLLL